MMTPDPVEKLVRQALEADAKTVDAQGMLHRLQSAKLVEPRRSRRWVVGVIGAAIAASLVLFYLSGTGPTPQVLSASELVEQARLVHDGQQDFCYEVTAELDNAQLRKLKLEPIVRKSKLWTRGDQFWLETLTLDGTMLAWGQTTDKQFWATPNRRRGFLYEPDEVGEPITRYCEIISLRVVPMLVELLTEFDLVRQDAGQPGQPIRIAAEWRPRTGFPRFRFVELELDPTTKAVRYAMFRRQLNGENIGTLTFTLLETAHRPDADYTLAGHLDADAVILDKKQTGLRGKFREEFLKRLQMRLK
jgi:hypothetical protein